MSSANRLESDRAVTGADDPQGFDHRFATVNGIRLHYVEEGEGPLVLLLHGFPYLWFTWRHQIRALAAAGYRVVAPDFRGFGQSDAPADLASYESLTAVGDLVGLINTLEETSVVVVGHDLGAWIARLAAETRPDLIKALVMVASPIGPRAAISPSEQWKQFQDATGKRFYHHYFQENGDAELNADIRQSLFSVLYSLSGSAVGDDHFRILLGDGETILDAVTEPEQLPEWLPADAFEYYVSEYERHGFTPTLNYYRCLDRNWAQTAFLDGLIMQQPSMFIGGANDLERADFKRGYDQLESHLPNLRQKVLVEGAAHDAAEEDPDAVNRMLLEFLETV